MKLFIEEQKNALGETRYLVYSREFSEQVHKSYVWKVRLKAFLRGREKTYWSFANKQPEAYHSAADYVQWNNFKEYERAVEIIRLIAAYRLAESDKKRERDNQARANKFKKNRVVSFNVPK